MQLSAEVLVIRGQEQRQQHQQPLPLQSLALVEVGLLRSQSQGLVGQTRAFLAIQQSQAGLLVAPRVALAPVAHQYLLQFHFLVVELVAVGRLAQTLLVELAAPCNLEEAEVGEGLQTTQPPPGVLVGMAGTA